jgi:alpha-L-fucosidase
MATYQPTFESVSRHPVPAWYNDAKFGIFIHWGPSAVPGWAVPNASIDQIISDQGWQALFKNNPYSGWYQNSLRFPDSPTRQHHDATYGAGFAYEQFGPQFAQAASQWNPDTWADLFARVHARYVVLTSKHHDGYLLWNSRHPNPHQPGYQTERDLVGELARAVRSKGLRYGLYYSSGLDWTFNDAIIDDFNKVFTTIVQSEAFIAYVDAHWRELFERYQPDVIWGDIGHPAKADVARLFADYYNSIPDGVINDRFAQIVPERDTSDEGIIGPPSAPHYDFRTPEYTAFKEIQQEKWETCRGIGYAFFYNQNETDEHYASVTELVHLLVDIVSKNGNLLLDVGPMADGTIPALQVERLEGIGRWLDVNGSAIFGTRPWVVADGETTDGLSVRYTRQGDTLNAVLLGQPTAGQVTLPGLRPQADSRIRWLGQDEAVPWQVTDGSLSADVSSALPDSPAHTLTITPIPEYVS